MYRRCWFARNSFAWFRLMSCRQAVAICRSTEVDTDSTYHATGLGVDGLARVTQNFDGTLLLCATSLYAPASAVIPAWSRAASLPAMSSWRDKCSDKRDWSCNQPWALAADLERGHERVLQ